MTQIPELTAKTPLYRPFPRLAGRLYIFPALIPMVELVPWLLGAVGAAAGLTSFIRASSFMRRHRKAALVFAGACFAAMAGIAVWTQAHIPTDEEGSRLQEAAAWPKLTRFAALPQNPAQGGPSRDFAPVWSAPTKNESLSTPVVAGDLLLTGTFASTVEARARSGGALLWSLQKHESIFTNVVVLKDRALVGEGVHTSLASTLTEFSLPDGKVLWDRQFLSHVESPPLAEEAENRLWLGAGDESVWCLSLADGAALWRRKIGHADSTPLLSGGKLFIETWPDSSKHVAKLYALDPANGKTAWDTDLTGDIMGSPQEGPGGMILATTAIGQLGPKVATDRGWAHAVSAEGKRLWTVELPGLPLPEALVLKRTDKDGKDASLVIETIKTGQLVALRAADGTTAWSAALGAEFDAPASLRGGAAPPLLAAVTKEGVVALLDAEDGAAIRRFNLPAGGYAAPVFDGDDLYIATPDNIVAYGGLHLLATEIK